MARTLNSDTREDGKAGRRKARQTSAETEGPGDGDDEDGDDPKVAETLLPEGERAAYLATANETLLELDRQLEKAREKAKKINKQRSATYRDVKSRTGVTRKNFEFIRDLAGMEEDARAESMTQLRLCSDGLSIGEQASFASILDDSVAAKPNGRNGNGAKEDVPPGYTSASGADAYRANKRRDDCPHKPGSASAKAWLAGFNDAEIENARSMAPKPSATEAAFAH